MAEQRSEKSGAAETEEEGEDRKKSADLELFSCLLQPASSDADPHYVGVRRLLLHSKAEAGVLRRRVRDSYFRLCLTFLVSLCFCACL